jgi:hypothetical protein
MLLLSLFFFCLAIRAQSNPNDLVCENSVISLRQWETKFPTNLKFNGNFKADGSITFYAPGDVALFSINLDGSLWRQYFDANGFMIGDLYLNGAAFGFPGVLVKSSSQVVNPMIGSLAACQKFMEPAPTNLITSYSVLESYGKGYMASRYYSPDAATLNEIFSHEQFSFSSDFQTAISTTTTINLGNAPVHFTSVIVKFRYTAITEAAAQAMGWGISNVNATVGKGFHAGRGAIPHTILSSAQRAQLGL